MVSIKLSFKASLSHCWPKCIICPTKDKYLWTHMKAIYRARNMHINKKSRDWILLCRFVVVRLKLMLTPILWAWSGDTLNPLVKRACTNVGCWWSQRSFTTWLQIAKMIILLVNALSLNQNTCSLVDLDSKAGAKSCVEVLSMQLGHVIKQPQQSKETYL